MKIYSYYVLLILLLSFTHGCKNSQNMIIYGSLNGNSPNSFIFYSDSTFKFESHDLSHAFEYSYGRWAKEGMDKIVLMSDIQDKILPVSIRPEYNTISKSEITIDVRINGECITEVYECIPIINGDTLSHLTLNNCKLELNQKLKSLSFIIFKNPFSSTGNKWSLHPLETKKNVLTKQIDSGAYLADIKVVDSLFSYKIFTNQLLIKKGTNIYYKESGISNELQIIPNSLLN